MLIIKNIMLFSVFIISFFIGKYMSKQYVDRLTELEEIKKALNIFKTKIKFTYDPIPEIFKEISNTTNTTNYNISNLFKNAVKKMENHTASIAWEKSINEYTGNLNEKDKQCIQTLSKLLRHNRHRRTIMPGRSNRKFFRRTN